MDFPHSWQNITSSALRSASLTIHCFSKLCLPDMIFSTLINITLKQICTLRYQHTVLNWEVLILYHITGIMLWHIVKQTAPQGGTQIISFASMNDSLQQNCMCKCWCVVNTIFKHHLSLSLSGDAVTHCCITEMKLHYKK
jgi:hypothetical protein